MKLIVSFLLLVLAGSATSGQETFFNRLADSTYTLTQQTVIYDPQYTKIGYPNGDVPANKGVCTDVIIRAYRKLGIDLQKEVHEDMRGNFKIYPQRWGHSRPDKNIDHRRVPNLMTFFTRHGTVKKVTSDPKDYMPGDIVCWDLGGGITHIGMVINMRSSDNQRYLIVHNIGAGQVAEDMLFEYTIIGHYQYKK